MRQFAWMGPALMIAGSALCAAQETRTVAALERATGEVPALPGEPGVAERAGVTRGDLPLPSIETREPADGPKRRLVLVGGLDGDPRGVDAVLGAVRWFKTEAPAALPQRWTVSALPCGNPEGWIPGEKTNAAGGLPSGGYPPAEGYFHHPQAPEARYLWRWIAFQAPDLVLEVRGGEALRWLAPSASPAARALRAEPLESSGSLPTALAGEGTSGLGAAPALLAYARAEEGPALLRALLEAAADLPESPLRQEVRQRLSRSPLDTASLLAARYPASPSVTYIPAVAWSGALRLARLREGTPEAARLREKVREALRPYLSGEKPSLMGNPDVVKLAGHLIFADLAQTEGDASARRLALEAADRYRPAAAGEPARYGRYWTDDMFMTCTLLGRAARLSGERAYHDLSATTVLRYAEKLQRPDGLFIHAPDAPHAWGRGNGFAALGLMETLTYLPADHPERGAVLAVYRKQMAALKPLQTPEGTWRQVIDARESYREVTATAMTLAAMARGLRLGWLDAGYRPTVDRAWKGLQARIVTSGGLVDVCTGTGAGPTLRYYYDRPAVFGPDDRGGAMCLMAALEMAELK